MADVWEYYYSEQNPQYISGDNISIKATNGKLFILFSNFVGYSSQVISISQSNLKILHSQCMFKNCHSGVSQGGTIYFSGNSEIVQDRTCATLCYGASSFGAFCYSETGSGSKKKNFVFDSTIVNCGVNKTGDGIIGIQCGNITLKGNNVSSSFTHVCCGHSLKTPTDLGIVCYSTYENNTALYWECLYQSRGQTNISKCNLVRNSASPTSYSLIFYDDGGYGQIADCYVYFNKNEKSFGSSNRLCYVVRCNSDKPTIYGNVDISAIATENFTNKLHHLQTKECYAVNVEFTSEIYQSLDPFNELIQMYLLYS